MKPLIGITMSRIEAGRCLNYGEMATVPQPYIDAVVAAGGVPLIVPNVPEIVPQVVPLLAGLILIGGPDITPSLYTDEPVHPKTYGLHPAREQFEFGLVQAALKQEVPILGICRGIQTLNVALGGTLVQDIPDQWPGALPHAPREAEVVRHPVTVEPGSYLAQIVGTLTIDANSYHHQAIKTVAPGLTPTGRAPDGVIEAVEGRDWPFVVGVQWHPELLAADEEAHAALFQALVEAAKREREREA